MSRSYPSGKNDCKSFKKPVWLDGSQLGSISNDLKSEIASSVCSYIDLQNKWNGKRGRNRRSFLQNTAEYLGETPSSLQRRINRYSFRAQSASDSLRSPAPEPDVSKELSQSPRSSCPALADSLGTEVISSQNQSSNVSKIRRKSSIYRSSKSSGEGSTGSTSQQTLKSHSKILRSDSQKSSRAGQRTNLLNPETPFPDQYIHRPDQQTIFPDSGTHCVDPDSPVPDQETIRVDQHIPLLPTGGTLDSGRGTRNDPEQRVRLCTSDVAAASTAGTSSSQLLRQPRLQLNNKMLERLRDGSGLIGLAREEDTPVLESPSPVSCAVCSRCADVTKLNCRFDRWLCDVCLNFIVGISQDKCDTPTRFKCSNKNECRISVSASPLSPQSWCRACWLSSCLLQLHVPSCVRQRLLLKLPGQLRRRLISSDRPSSSRQHSSALTEPPGATDPNRDDTSSPGGRCEKVRRVGSARVLELGSGWRRRERVTGRRWHVVVVAPDGTRFRSAVELQAYLRGCGRSPSEAHNYFTAQVPVVSTPTVPSVTTTTTAAEDGAERTEEGDSRSGVRRRGPRVKMVCRSAAVALSQPRATFADLTPSVSSQSCISTASAVESRFESCSGRHTPGTNLPPLCGPSASSHTERLRNSSFTTRRRFSSLLKSSFVSAAKKVVRKYRQKKRAAVAAAAAAVVRDQLSTNPELSEAFGSPRGQLFSSPQLSQSGGGLRVRRSRCGSCAGCSSRNCKRCLFCQDMTRYGGPGRLRKPCPRRSCLRPLLPGISRLRQLASRRVSTANRKRPRRGRKPREAAAVCRVKTPRFTARSTSGGGDPAGTSRSSLVYTAPALTATHPVAPSNRQPLHPHQEPDEAVDLGALPAEGACVWRYGFAVVSPQPINTPILCFICGSAGTDELVFCCGCCEPFHLFCLDYCDVPVTGLQLDSWLCRSCQLCSVCGTAAEAGDGGEDGELQQLLVRCRQCGETFHERCTDRAHRCPVAIDVDTEKLPWTCEKCCKCRACCNSDADRFVGNLPLCSQCYTLHRRGNYCPLCGGGHQATSPGREKHSEKVLECESCHVWVHATCERLSDELYHVLCHTPASVCYLCDRCQPQTDSSSSPAGTSGSWRRCVLEQLQQGCAALVRCVGRHLSAAGESCEDSIRQLLSAAVGSSSRDQLQLVSCHERLMALLGRIQGRSGKRYQVAVQQYHTVMRHRFPWFLPSLSLTPPTETALIAPALPTVQHPPACRPASHIPRRPSSAAGTEWPRALLDLCSRQYRALRGLETGRGTHLSGSPTALATGNQSTLRRACYLCSLTCENSSVGRLIWCGALRWLHAGCLLISAGAISKHSRLLLAPDGAVSTLGADCAVSRLCAVCGGPGAPLRCRGSSNGISCKLGAHLLCAMAPDSCWSLVDSVYCGLHAERPVHEATGPFLSRRLVVEPTQRRRRAAVFGMVPVDQVSVCIGALTLHSIGTKTVCDGGTLVPDGLVGSRVYWSTVNPRRRTVYLVRVTFSRDFSAHSDQFHCTVDHSQPIDQVEKMMASLENWRTRFKLAVPPTASPPSLVISDPASPEDQLSSVVSESCVVPSPTFSDVRPTSFELRSLPTSSDVRASPTSSNIVRSLPAYSDVLKVSTASWNVVRASPTSSNSIRDPAISDVDQANQAAIEEEVRACVDALVTQVCRSVLEEEEPLRLDDFNMPILETMDSDLITLMLNELCEAGSSSHSGLLLSSSPSSPTSSPPPPPSVPTESAMDICPVYEAKHSSSESGVKQSNTAEGCDLRVEKGSSIPVLDHDSNNNSTQLRYSDSSPYHQQHYQLQQPSRPVPVQPPLRSLVPPSVDRLVEPPAGLRVSLGDGLHQSAFRPAVRRSHLFTTSSSSSSGCFSQPTEAKPVAAVIPEPRDHLPSAAAGSWPVLSGPTHSNPGLMDSAAGPFPSIMPQYGHHAQLCHWSCAQPSEWPLSWSHQTERNEGGGRRGSWPRFWQCDGAADSCSSCSESEPVDDNSPVKCPRCRRLYRTRPSMLRHAAVCTLDVDSGDNSASSADESTPPINTLSIPRSVPSSPGTLPPIPQTVPPPQGNVAPVLQAGPPLPQRVPSVHQASHSQFPTMSVPSTSVVASLTNVPQPVPQVIYSVPNVPQPVPQVIQPVPNIPQSVPRVIQSVSNVPQPVPQVVHSVPNVPLPVPQVVHSVPIVPLPVPQAVHSVPSVPQPVPQVIPSVPNVPLPVPQVIQSVPNVAQPVSQMFQSVLNLQPIPQVLQSVPNVPHHVPQVVQAVPNVLRAVPEVPHMPQVLQRMPGVPQPVSQLLHPVMNVPQVLRSISNVPHVVSSGRPLSLRVQPIEDLSAQTRASLINPSSKQRSGSAQHGARPGHLGSRSGQLAEHEVSSTTVPHDLSSTMPRAAAPSSSPSIPVVRQPVAPGRRRILPRQPQVVSAARYCSPVSTGVAPTAVVPVPSAQWLMVPLQQPCTNQLLMMPASASAAPTTLTLLPPQLYQNHVLPVLPGANIRHLGSFEVPAACSPALHSVVAPLGGGSSPLQSCQVDSSRPLSADLPPSASPSSSSCSQSAPSPAAPISCVPATAPPDNCLTSQAAQSNCTLAPTQNSLVPSPSVPISCVPETTGHPARPLTTVKSLTCTSADQLKDARKVAKVKPRPTYSYRAAMNTVRSSSSSSSITSRLLATTAASTPVPVRVYVSRGSFTPRSQVLNCSASYSQVSADTSSKAPSVGAPAYLTKEDSSLPPISTDRVSGELGVDVDDPHCVADDSDDSTIDTQHVLVSRVDDHLTSQRRGEKKPESKSRGEKPESKSRGEKPESKSRGEKPESKSRGEKPESKSRGEKPESKSRGEKPESKSRGEEKPSSKSGVEEKVAHECQGEGKVLYEITSADGFNSSSTDLTSLWRSVFEAVQEARSGQKMRAVQYNGDSLDGRKLLGLTHSAVQALLKQLPSADSCPAHPLRENEKAAEVSSCARTLGFSGRKRADVFGWLASPHRSPPVPSDAPSPPRPRPKLGGSKCWRHSTMLELPLAMRYRQLRVTCHSRVGVYRSPIAGRGLFCRRHLDPSEMVIEYVGEMIRASLADVREKKYSNRGLDCYMFRVDDDWVVDATERGNAARFINHSCRPNCYSRVVDILGKKRIIIFALRQICRGEELTYDYKFAIEEDKIPCNCGAKRCRKYLN